MSDSAQGAERLAAIDVGTNTVLLLVAERRGPVVTPILERAEITRLGRGVDATGLLDRAAIEETVKVIAEYALEARNLGALKIACVATSAARDAANGSDFFLAAQKLAGVSPRIIGGDDEARLVYGSAWRDFGGSALAVLDVGGGSTEFIFGKGPAPGDRTSLQVGAVRLTERHLRSDPPSQEELLAVREGARVALAPLERFSTQVRGARLVGVAGTVTTLAAVDQALAKYDGQKVHGSSLSLERVEALARRLASMTVRERAELPGMEPKRADVIVAGALVVAEAMCVTGFSGLTVSDRGVRWGLIYEELFDRSPSA